RLYLVDDATLGVERSCLGEDVFVRSIKRYEYAARYVEAGDLVADCACGSGYGSQILKTAGAATVVGIDGDPLTIEYARRHYGEKGVSFECQDIHHLTFPPGSFNVVA